MFLALLSDKNQTIRLASVECVKLVMERTVQDQDLKDSLAKGDALSTMEKCVKKALEDAMGTVRELGKDSFHHLQLCWPTRATKYDEPNYRLLDSLDTSTKKAVMKRKIPAKTELDLPSLSNSEYAIIAPTTLAISSPVSEKTLPEESKVPEKIDKSETSEQLDDASMDVVSEPEEEGILLQLQNFDSKIQLRGFYALLNIVQEFTLSKCVGALELDDDLDMIREKLLSLYTIADGEFLSSLVDFDYILILLEGDVVSYEQIFLPLVTIRCQKDQSAAITEQIDRFFTHINDLKSNIEYLALLFDALTKRTTGLRMKITSEMRELERGANEKIIEMVNELIFSNKETNLNEIFFKEDSNVRMALHILAPIVSLKLTKQTTKAAIRLILSSAFQTQPQLFLKTLNTIDFEIAQLIKEALNIQQEPDDQEFTTEQDLSMEDQEYDISQIEGETQLVDMTFDDEDMLNV